MVFAALVLVIIITVSVVLSRRTSRRSLGSTFVQSQVIGGKPRDSGAMPRYVESLLSRWSGAGLLSQEQVDRIREFESSAAVPSRSREQRTRVHAIAEALGYLGGVLGLTGLIVLIAEFWDDFTDLVRLGVPLGATAVFVISGIVVPERRSSAMLRLRTFVWTLAVASAGVSAWVFADVVLDVEQVRRNWLAVGIVTSIVSVAMWSGRNRPVQQFTAIAGAAIALGTFIGEFATEGFSGIGLWIAGAILVVFSIRTAGLRAGVDVLAGSILVVVGALLTVAQWMGPGLVFVLISGAILIAPAALKRIEVPSPASLVTGIAGTIALVQGVPTSIAHFSNDAGVVTGLVVWGVGLICVSMVVRHVLRMDLVFLVTAGAAFVGGAAVTGTQSVGFATLFGLATSVGLIVFGARPGRSLMSVFGLVGIMVFIPWAISHFFPGEGRVPLLIIVSGLVLVGVAVVLARLGSRLRGDVHLGSRT